MTSHRLQELCRKLERNKSLVLRTFGNVQPEGWGTAVHEKPGSWTLRELLAHFVSSERMLLTLSQDVAGGGRGAPPGFDYDAFNKEEQETFRQYKPQELLKLFVEARDATLVWMGGLV
jgi:hypothetical protein